jgi:P4 family phage/plasmid primase-like protien
MNLIIYTANCSGNAKNCFYPNREVITNKQDLLNAVSKDHVCGVFKSNYRSASNFISSNVVVMDNDNDHSENPKDWISIDQMAKMLGDIAFAIVPSKNHLISKDKKVAREKYHVYLPCGNYKSAEEYGNLKKAIHKKFPFFDDNALDVSRFIYGVDINDSRIYSSCILNESDNTIEDLLKIENTTLKLNNLEYLNNVITSGKRNSTLSRFAGRIVKRYGANDKSYKIFMDESKKCDPPMELDELELIWKSATKFANKVKNQEGYIDPKDYNDDFSNNSLKPTDYSDIGQAKILTREYKDELMYTDATDYLRFNGQYWVESKQQAVGVMEEFLDLQLKNALEEVEIAKQSLIDIGISKDLIESGGKKLEKVVEDKEVLQSYLNAIQYLKFVMKRRDMKYITSALQAAKPMLSREVRVLDNNPNLLNTPSGTYDLTKGIDSLREHSASDYITKITECLSSDIGKEIWEDTLNLIFCNDEKLIEYVQLIIGMTAFGKVYQEHLIVAVGSGANGKSTIFNTIARVLGSYSGKISAEILTVGCKRNVKPEMAELKGKRLIIASETEEGMRLNTSVVKQLCSTDEIEAEKKYKDPFHYEPSHTIILYTNHLPKVGANDDGIWRRLIVIPFNAKIEGSSDIKNYTDYLVKNAGGYVLNWIIEGAKKAYDLDFKFELPKCVSEAIREYRETNDWFSVFISECCEVDNSFVQKSGEFYEEYRAYCLRNGEFTRSTMDFYQALKLAGFERKRTNKGFMIKGLRLKNKDFID